MAPTLAPGVSEDTVANFIRLGGIAAILAGALMGFTDIYHTVAQQLITAYGGSPTEQVGSIIFLTGRVLIVFGLPALYLHHAASAGKFSAFHARIFPRPASVLLALGILLPLLPFSPSWIFIIPYSAIVWMGFNTARATMLQRTAALV